MVQGPADESPAVPGVALRTARLLLRRFEAGDVDDAQAYRDDPRFARYLPHIPLPFTREDAEAFVATNMTEPWETLPTFAVVLDGHVIGTVNFEIADGRAMLGYAIARACWGRGLAVEAATAAIAWLHAERGVRELWAMADPRNLRSRRVLDKLGFTLTHETAEEVRYARTLVDPVADVAPPG